jgi:hypothetical protein
MTTLKVLLQSNRGPVFADKAICDYCSNDEFFILIIFGHNHLQCTSCGTSYCQAGGSCTRPGLEHNKPKKDRKKKQI